MILMAIIIIQGRGSNAQGRHKAGPAYAFGEALGTEHEHHLPSF